MTPTDLLILIPLLILMTSWGIGDIIIAAYYRPRYGTPTITARIQSLSSRYIAIPFITGLITGLLMGHLFLQF